MLFDRANSTSSKNTAANLLILVRPKGFEPLTPWFEEAYSERRKSRENKAFAHFWLCYESSD